MREIQTERAITIYIYIYILDERGERVRGERCERCEIGLREERDRDRREERGEWEIKRERSRATSGRPRCTAGRPSTLRAP